MPGMRRSRRRYYSREDATPLITAVVMMQEEPQRGWVRLRKAIQSRPNMDEQDADGFSALMYAVRLNMPNIIPALVEAGATVDLKDEDGNTPFFYACMFRHWEVMDKLFTLGADPDVHDENGLTALLTAIDDQDLELVEKLLKLGASPNACSLTGVAPLLMALSHKHRKYDTAILRRLLEAGADVNMANQVHGITPLMVACHSARRYTEAAQMLIRRGASIHAKDDRGRTPIHFCLRTVHNFPCLRLLLKSGASPNVVDKRGETPLSLLGHCIEKCGKTDTALENLYLKTLTELLTYGADPNTATSQASPNKLMSAFIRLENSHVAVKALLAAGAEPASPDSQMKDSNFDHQTSPSSSPLTYALDSGNVALGRLLVDGLFYTRCDLMYLSTHCASPGSSKNARPMSGALHGLSNTQSNRAVTSPQRTASPGDEATGRSRSPLINVHVQNLSLVSENSASGSDINPNTAQSSAATAINRCATNSRHDIDNGNSIAAGNNAASVSMNSSGKASKTTSPVKRTATRSNNARRLASPRGDSAQSTQSSDDQSQQSQSSIDDQHHGTQGVTSRRHGNNLQRSNSRPLGISSEYWSQIRDIATQVCQNPPSLQQLCRRSVLRAIGARKERTASVSQLPIWAKLQRYILFQGREYH